MREYVRVCVHFSPQIAGIQTFQHCFWAEAGASLADVFARAEFYLVQSLSEGRRSGDLPFGQPDDYAMVFRPTLGTGPHDEESEFAGLGQ